MSDEPEPIENVETSPPDSNQPKPVSPHSGDRFVGTEPGDRAVLKFEQIEIPFRWCPPGKFCMGSPKTDAMRFDSEDQVDVTLSKGFWLMETPVTQGLWRAVTGKKLRWTKEYGRGPNHPAYGPDWNRANEFAAKLTQTLVSSGQLPKDMKLILPTEAQWEYACRAGTTTRYPFGDDPADLHAHAWFSDNSIYQTHEVGGKAQNAWGLHDLHDMLGNVWEWCADTYAEKLCGGVDPCVSGKAGPCVIRGGCFTGGVRAYRPAFRNWRDPQDRGNDLGFRLAAVRLQ